MLLIIIIILLIILCSNTTFENFIWNNSTRYRPSYDIRGDPNLLYKFINKHLIPIGHYYEN